MRSFYLLPSKKLAVIWSQKCACSSVVDWVVNEQFLTKGIEVDGDKRAFLQSSPYTMPLKYMRPLLELNAIKFVAFTTRNPMQRMYSSYINKFVIRNGKYLKKISQLESFSKEFLQEVISFEADSTSLDNPANQPAFVSAHGDFGLSFYSFLRFIIKNSSTSSRLNAHFRPQILSGSTLNLFKRIKRKTKIFPLRVESFDDDLRRINECVGSSYIPPHINSTKLPSDSCKTLNSFELLSETSFSLIEAESLPSKESLAKFFQHHPKLKSSFMKFFDHDFSLIAGYC